MKPLIFQPRRLGTSQIGLIYRVVVMLDLFLVGCVALSSTRATPVAGSCVDTPPLTTAEVAQLFEQKIEFDLARGWKEIQTLTYEKRGDNTIGVLSLVAFRTSSASPQDCATEMMRLASADTPIDGYVGRANASPISGLETYTLMAKEHTLRTGAPLHSVLLAMADQEYVYLFSWDIFGDEQAFDLYLGDITYTVVTIEYQK